MKCFYDRSQDAIGMCKSCCRAICAEHTTEFDDGLACRGRCEAQVERINEMINNEEVDELLALANESEQATEFDFNSTAFLLLIGLVFILGEAIVNGFTLPAIVGTIFIACGCWQTFFYPKKSPQTHEDEDLAD